MITSVIVSVFNTMYILCTIQSEDFEFADYMDFLETGKLVCVIVLLFVQ